jgi:membrane protein required for colicin V production
MTGMTGFDIAVLVVLGLTAVTGFMRGFVQEVFALAAWVLALVAIKNLHAPLTAALFPYVGTESGSAVLAFAILLLIPYAIVKLLANRMGEASRNSVLGPIDRLLGFGFGAVKGMVVVVMAFSLLMLGSDTILGSAKRKDWITLSRSYPFVDAGSRYLVSLISERRKAAMKTEAERVSTEAVKSKLSGK